MSTKVSQWPEFLVNHSTAPPSTGCLQLLVAYQTEMFFVSSVPKTKQHLEKPPCRISLNISEITTKSDLEAGRLQQQMTTPAQVFQQRPGN